MHARDPSSSARRSAGVDRPRQYFSVSAHGIWASLTPEDPRSSHMSKVHSFPCFRELDCYERSCSSHDELPSPAASSPIQAAPGYRYRQYRMHEVEGGPDEGRHDENIRHGKSAPMDVLPQWRGCRKQRNENRRKARRSKHRGELEEEVEEEELEDAEATMAIGDWGRRAEEEQEEGEERLPPHELLERERAAATSCGGAAFSLCQGVGRTLKGRDLCRVRNAILKQTGFI